MKRCCSLGIKSADADLEDQLVHNVRCYKAAEIVARIFAVEEMGTKKEIAKEGWLFTFLALLATLAKLASNTCTARIERACRRRRRRRQRERQKTTVLISKTLALHVPLQNNDVK